MMSVWWSVALAVIGVAGLYLTTKKLAVGFAVGVAVQVLWIVYAVISGQYGFIFSALAFAVVNALGLWRWTRKADVTNPPSETEAFPPTYIHNHPSVPKSEPTQSEDSEEQESEEPSPILSQSERGLYISRMPPTEYTAKGEPMWRHYPFIQVFGGRIVIGPQNQKRYVLSVEQAFFAGRAIVEAAEIAAKKLEERNNV